MSYFGTWFGRYAGNWWGPITEILLPTLTKILRPPVENRDYCAPLMESTLAASDMVAIQSIGEIDAVNAISYEDRILEVPEYDDTATIS